MTQFIDHLGHKLAYQHVPAGACGVMFLPGFRSDMQGMKAGAVREWCAAHHVSYTSLDYFSHGQSEGDFLAFTISQALADVLKVIDDLTHGPLILVGSSMGGWLMLLAALARPERISGLVGIAAAPDFTEKLMFAHFSADQHADLRDQGVTYVPSGYGFDDYPITSALMEDGRKHMLLDDQVALRAPVMLLHGQQDADVPWQYSLSIAEKITGDEVAITLVKDGNHRLSRPQDILLLQHTLTRMLHLTNP